MNHVTLDGAYGIPVDIDIASIKYGAMIFDGASLSVTNPTFIDINTTNVLAFDGAFLLMAEQLQLLVPMDKATKEQQYRPMVPVLDWLLCRF